MPYIVTERIDGGSLHQVFDAAPLSLSDVIEIAARMTTAVHELHKQDVIHLDLKPENFLQRPTGEMVCIDFGLSRHEALPDLLAEEFTIPMGTFPYIASEQLLRSRDDLRSDIFALGRWSTSSRPAASRSKTRDDAGSAQAPVARSGAAPGHRPVHSPNGCRRSS